MTVVAGEYRTLNQVLNEFDKIIIPDVQRDYVMASGGDKFTKLLKAMTEVQKKESLDEKFNFSCLVGYKDAQNTLHVYDGQQRLVTLVYLCSYLNAKNMDFEKKLLLEKFYFTNRTEANYWLRNLDLIEEDNATDFTTYSLVQLIKQFKAFSAEIDFDFLFNKVVFSLVLVNETSDAEKFFLDINDGLDLKTYEIYKAELYHHAKAKLSEEEFRSFALKMENRWLEFFLSYRYEANEYINRKQIKKIYCEEEMLIFFLHYCFRMIWIEENQTDTGYRTLNISWLTKEHIQRVERIIDTLIIQIKTSSISKITCINYSNNENYHYDYKGRPSNGQHWAIDDENYVSMLDIFLKNAYSEEINKDIVIWCYISNLPFIKDYKDILYDYLRFVKKLLNNNRKISEQAEVLFNDWGIYPKKIIYARYYVEGIPQYYRKNIEKESLGNNTINFLNSIIVLNKGNILNEEDGYLDIFFRECKLEELKSILEKEQKKHKSKHNNLIRKYENLRFTNGLVNNFLIYKDGEYFIDEFWEKEFYNTFNKESFLSDTNQYKDILKFLIGANVNINNSIFSNVSIYWRNYSVRYKFKYEVSPHLDNGNLIPHTWCDFFTSEQGISFNKDSQKKFPEYLAMLPDGWISKDEIIQPQDDLYSEKGVGFASWSKKHKVWDMEDFSRNFSWISRNDNGKYIVDGIECHILPDYLKDFNNKNWIINNLVEKKKIFFTTDMYLNKILLKKLQMVSPLTGEKFYDTNNQQVDFETYLKVKKGYMKLSELDYNYYFIKVDDIE